ncbi:MAG: guanylate kinase, partial [Muribaculaceae bacterium]|nr:guanylate kinase [Muribaculaceae bacterium]
VNVKKMYSDSSLSIFIQPPSIEALRDRLVNRGTETPASLADRIGRAEYELSFAPQFDVTIVNDDLTTAINEAEARILSFINA